jgi:uncharacterized protein YxjI
MLNRSSFTQTLSEIEVIYVRQIVEIGELFGYESRNRFSIQTEDGREFGYCKEPKLDWQDSLARQYLGHWRNFDLVATDHLGQKCFRAHHPFRWFLRRLDLFSPGDRYLGSLQQRFAWWDRKFDFIDANGRTIANMSASIWKPWTFPVTQDSKKIAVIEKKWSGALKELFTDADNFRIRFFDSPVDSPVNSQLNSQLTNDRRLLVLVSAIFVDLLYFERRAR